MTADWHRIDDPENPPPRDGTGIMVWMAAQRMHYVVRWIRSEEVGPVYVTPDGHMLFGITHWMPLPPPPVTP